MADTTAVAGAAMLIAAVAAASAATAVAAAAAGTAVSSTAAADTAVSSTIAAGTAVSSAAAAAVAAASVSTTATDAAVDAVATGAAYTEETTKTDASRTQFPQQQEGLVLIGWVQYVDHRHSSQWFEVLTCLSMSPMCGKPEEEAVSKFKVTKEDVGNILELIPLLLLLSSLIVLLSMLLLLPLETQGIGQGSRLSKREESWGQGTER